MAWHPFWPKYLKDTLGASTIEIGLISGVRSAQNMIFALPGGLLADKYGRKKVIVYGTFLNTFSPVIYFLAPSWHWIMVAAFFEGMTDWNRRALTLPTIQRSVSNWTGRPETSIMEFELADTDGKVWSSLYHDDVTPFGKEVALYIKVSNNPTYYMNTFIGNVTGIERSMGKVKLRAKATFATAIHDPLNWLNLLLPLGSVLLGVLWLALGWLAQDGWKALFGLAYTALSLAGGYLYLRYMRSISFELTDEVFHYQAEGRRLHFAWKEIEAVKIQPKVKRLTIWAHSKPRAMQYVGIADGEFTQLNRFLQAKIAEYGIQQK